MAISEEGGAVKLNVGCGKRMPEGWFCLDIARDPEAPRDPDLLCDARTIPLPDGCADELMAIHLFEHLYRWEAEPALDEWCRLLKPGGRIVLELPNIVKCCENYLSGRTRGGKDPDQLARWGLFGDPRTGNPYMNHRWAYSPAEMIGLLHAHGFKEAREVPTQFHPAGRAHRDMRIEAVRA